jgi:hypothetical protein
MIMNTFTPGPIVLMGSGETSPSSGTVFEEVAKKCSSPLRIAILETPAGFELNSDRVAGRVEDFLQNRLQNYHPVIDIIPARKKGSDLSPDSESILEPLYRADMIFMGPGSPTYTARQLAGSLAYQVIQARQRTGAALVLASAATIAFGCQTMPVYEIFKAGMDLHWQPGLDFFQHYGLSLVIIPHWNNAEGGAELDTSHCFMGKHRFEELEKLLDCHGTILGIDEHTSIWMEPGTNSAKVYGKGMVHIIKGSTEKNLASGETFPMTLFGSTSKSTNNSEGISDVVWKQTCEFAAISKDDSQQEIPEEVASLLKDREEARLKSDYSRADSMRDQAKALGWAIEDTVEGARLRKLE